MAEPGDMPVRRCASYMCKKNEATSLETHDKA